MNQTDINIRPATPEDALFIARGFHTAMLYENVEEERTRLFAENVCSRDDVLYSWKNTIIAEVEGKPAGMITSYVGSQYKTLQINTFRIIKELFNTEFPGMEDETVPGEYYLDSLAVLPAFRGKGIGRTLLETAIKTGKDMGLVVTLAVAPVNERAQNLYKSLGFGPAGDLFIFGHTYWKLKQ